MLCFFIDIYTSFYSTELVPIILTNDDWVYRLLSNRNFYAHNVLLLLGLYPIISRSPFFRFYDWQYLGGFMKTFKTFVGLFFSLSYCIFSENCIQTGNPLVPFHLLFGSNAMNGKVL
jgi:hypothetical protein